MKKRDRLGWGDKDGRGERQPAAGGLGELYEEEAAATHPLLRWSHLLDRLETALDGAGRIAGILESLVIKHA